MRNDLGRLVGAVFGWYRRYVGRTSRVRFASLYMHTGSTEASADVPVTHGSRRVVKLRQIER
ncbi:hypothetical protein BVI434_850019 [Burkholderia vietnamiensis]|nr:hypothetical protein BVI434_850019 [Burkholderia vietnamiensis]